MRAGLIETILADGIEAGLAGDAAIAASIAQANAFWTLRENISDAQKPRRRLDQARHLDPGRVHPGIHRARGAAVEAVSPGARVVCFGHMGDGNLHYNISQPVGADPKAFLALYRPMNKAVHDIVRELDGSISAEHGIGQLKRDELLATAPPVGIDLMRRIKAAFDPAGIMNPGKVL